MKIKNISLRYWLALILIILLIGAVMITWNPHKEDTKEPDSSIIEPVSANLIEEKEAKILKSNDTTITKKKKVIKKQTKQKKKANKKKTTKKVKKVTEENKKVYQSYAHDLVINKYGWTEKDFDALVILWQKESGWNPKAKNKHSGAYGIPQALPGSKMKSAGADWKTNYKTQIKWGLKYIKKRYGSPSKAYGHFKKKGWY